MKLRLHVSPDAGWPCLSEFLDATRQRLVITMYDFGAKHVLDAILAKPARKEVVLVMQRSQSIGTGIKKADLPDAEVARALSDKFDKRFHFGWVKLGIKNGWVANSHHIKVAVQDSKAFWLSGGNWQSSNLPEVDLSGSADFSYLEKYNREWHAVVHHGGLVKRMRGLVITGLSKRRVHFRQATREDQASDVVGANSWKCRQFHPRWCVPHSPGGEGGHD